MLAERLDATEIMDEPGLPEATYRAVLEDLSRVNRITFAHRPTLEFLARSVGNRREFALLDVGFGHGDMLRCIADWAAKRNISARLVGIDLNPRSESIAREATDPALPITWLTGDYAGLAGAGFDVITSSLVAHHMTRDELGAFIRFMEDQAAAGWFVNDLHRHALSHAGYPLLARAMGWHEIVRKDGRTSIARAFRPHEWRELLARESVEGALVERRFPFRLCVAQIR